MITTDAAALHHFLREHGESLKKFEDAERRYAEVVEAYREKYRAKYDGTVTADFAAASDARLKQAIQDCAYYRDRAMAYGISALVELARGAQL